MHGKKREEYKAKFRDPKVAVALSQKAEQWHSLCKALSVRRSNERKEPGSNEGVVVDLTTTTKQTLGLIEKALVVNPDPLYLWNHRRECLSSLLSQSTNKQEEQEEEPSDDGKGKEKELSSSSSSDSILQTELALTQASLGRNPKAYGAWFHRKWILQQIQPSNLILEGELALTEQFLKLDERNFHCWNYRRFVVGCLASSWDGSWCIPTLERSTNNIMGSQIGVIRNGDDETASSKDVNIPTTLSKTLLNNEWDFTTTKIKENFSNFSAFHYRSQLLPYKLLSLDEANSADTQDLIEAELALVEDAVCTEPDDQTAWWYQAILFEILMNKNDGDQDSSPKNKSKIDVSRLEEHLELLNELLADSPKNKWILLGLHRVLQVLNTDQEEQKSILSQLMKVDSDRSQRYQELMK